MLIGIDIGGTKTHVRVVDASGVAGDTVVPTGSWQRDGSLTGAQSVENLVALFAPRVEAAHEAVLVVGAHGCDTLQQIAEFETALQSVFAGTVRVFNDAQLVGPAAGQVDAIALIAGTGAIAVGRTPQGDVLTAGGHGWLLADEGSAPALAREGVRAILGRYDATGKTDVLGELMLGAVGVTNVHDLALEFTRTATMQAWAALAPLIFEAADRGSSDATEVIASGANALAQLACGLRDRGALALHVVAAGGVVTNQPRLERHIQLRLEEVAHEAKFSVLRDAPVAGAIEIARTLVSLPVGSQR